MISLRVVLTLSLVSTTSACASLPLVGVIHDGDLDLSRDHYRVLATPESTLLPAGWQIENFRLEDGVPTTAKTGPEYGRPIRLDTNDDGLPDRNASIALYDLESSHARTGARMWTQTVPTSTRVGTRDLDVIAHDFVDRVGGGSYLSIDWAADAVRERHVGTVIREEGPVDVDGVPGYWVTFEIVSVDQREVDQSHRGEWVTVVLLRPRARWTPEERFTLDDTGFPMLITVGYASRAEHHTPLRTDFEGLLSRIDFHETR